MKINIPAALALLLTTAPLYAKPLSLLHWCSDGTAIHLREDNGRLTITWRGASFPVDKIQTGNLTVDMTGSTPNQSTVMRGPVLVSSLIMVPSVQRKREAISPACS